MMTDEIIREVWRAKDEIAKQFNYDIEALGKDLQRRQKVSGRKVVNLATNRLLPQTQRQIDENTTTF